MTWQELYAKLDSIGLTDVDISTDNGGQIIIYTGLIEEGETLVSMSDGEYEEDEEDGA